YELPTPPTARPAAASYSHLHGRQRQALHDACHDGQGALLGAILRRVARPLELPGYQHNTASPALSSPASSAAWLYASQGTNSVKAWPAGPASVSRNVKLTCCVPWSAKRVIGSRSMTPVRVTWFKSRPLPPPVRTARPAALLPRGVSRHSIQQ